MWASRPWTLTATVSQWLTMGSWSSESLVGCEARGAGSSWSGRHGTDRKWPAWQGKRQDRPGGQCAIHRGHRLGDEPWCHGEKSLTVWTTLDQYLGEGEATAARGSRWAGRHELDLLASRGGGGADGMVGREDRESVRERDVGQGTDVSFVVSVFEEKR